MAAPAQKTILLLVTVDDDSIIVSTPGGTASKLLRPAEAHKQLRDMVLDPLAPAAKREAGGFDAGDFFRGMGRAISELGKDDPK